MSALRFLQLPGKIQNLIYQCIYNEFKENNNKLAFDTFKVSRSWYNKIILLIVLSLNYTIMV